MQIRTKLNLILTGFIILTVSIIGIIVEEQYENTLRKTINENYATLALQRAETIDLILHDRIIETEVLAANDVILTAVKSANLRYQGKKNEDILSEIEAIDREWIVARNSDRIARRIFNNDLSVFLKQYEINHPGRYGEIIVTDIHGVNIGMSKILSDYNQSDESWWKDSFDAGKGKVFLEDRGYDQSAQVRVFGVGTPIRDMGEVIGILKINFNLKDIFNLVSSQTGFISNNIFILRSQGDIIPVSHQNIPGEKFDTEKLLSLKNDSGYGEINNFGKKILLGFAPVRTPFFTRIPNPGEIKEVSGEKYALTQWSFFVETDKKEAFLPIIRLRKIIITTLIFLLIIGAVGSTILAKTISEPIDRLQKSMEVIGQGNLDYQIGDTAQNEIGKLSRAFDEMTKKINSITTELKESKAAAENATKLKDSFVTLVAHDLRGPAGSISNLLGLLLQEKNLSFTEDQKKMLEVSQQSARKMNKLIGDILNVNRLKKGIIQPKYRFISASILTSKIVDENTVLAHKKGIKIINEIIKNGSVFTDEALLEVVFGNILSNAIKFSQDGDVVTIFMPPGEKNTLAISDTGCGIKPETLKNIFNYGPKLPALGTAGETGTGFGLPLSQEIIKTLGGALSVESGEGKGSTFFIRLPDYRPKIMIVDDEELFRMEQKMYLSGLKVDIVEAINGEDALTKIKTEKPHLIITDLNMPLMDGFCLLEKIKIDPETEMIPVIVVTALTGDDIRNEAIKKGAADYGTKPLKHEELILRVKRLLW